MKTCIFLLALFMSAAAWAIPPAAEQYRGVSIDMSKAYDQDEKYQSWLSSMAEYQIVLGEGSELFVSHEQLARGTYAMAKNRGWLAKGAEREEVYVKAVLAANGLLPGMSTPEWFRDYMIKIGGLRLPTEVDLQGNGTSAAAPKVVAPASKAAGTAAATPGSKTAASAVDAQAAQLAVVVEQLSKLRKQMERSGKAAGTFESKITALERTVSAVKSSSDEAVQEMAEKVEASLHAFRAGSFTADEGAQLRGELLGFSERLDTLEKVSLPMGYATLAAYSEAAALRYAANQGLVTSALSVVFLATIFLVLQWRQGKKNVAVQVQIKAHSDKIAKVEQLFEDVDERVLLLETRVHHPETGLAATRKLATEAKQLAQIAVGCTFDESIVQADALKALAVGERVELIVSHDKGPDLLLEVERSGENQVTVNGVLRQLGQTAPLVVDSLEGVAGKIYRADKGGRITGLATILNAQRKAA